MITLCLLLIMFIASVQEQS